VDRLSIVLTLMTGSVLVGCFVITVLSMGYYAWQPMAGAIAAGLILTWPAAYAISRKIKRDDPGWTLRSGAKRKRKDDKADFPET
jgi:hypothetical protein